MPTGPFAAAWIAAHSLHYWGEWRTYGLSAPAAADASMQPMPAENAVSILKQFDGHEGSLLRQMAIAEIARGVEEFSSQAVAFIRNLDEPQPIHIDAAGIASLLSISDRDARFLKALQLTAPKDTGIEDYSMTARFCPNSLLTEIEIEATIPKPAAALAPLADPRLWSTNYPSVWQRSDTISEPPTLADRDNDPAGSTVLGSTWTSRFFERLTFVAPGSVENLVLGDIRNVLNVTAQLTRNRLFMTYRNFECLSTQFAPPFDEVNQGGIDHDSGYGSVMAVPNDPSKSRVGAKKTVRYTQPRIIQRPLNELAFLNTLILMQFLVLGAAFTGLTNTVAKNG